MSPTRRTALAALAALVWASCACCAGSPGTLVGGSPNTSFASSEDRLWVRTPDGATLELGLDGSEPRAVVDASLYVLDLSSDASVVVLGNSDTDLFLRRGTDTREVTELKGRTGGVALSPDGRTLAAVRHADFDKPQSQWRDDNALYLVSVETGKVQIVPKSADEMITNLAWSRDGTTVWLRRFQGGAQSVSYPAGERADADWPAPDTLRRRPHQDRAVECGGQRIESAGWRFDEGINLVKDGEPARRLVKIEGRERGFHDYLPTLSTPFFTPDCRHVVFVYRENVWVADVDSGAVGPLHPASDAFVRPR